METGARNRGFNIPMATTPANHQVDEPEPVIEAGLEDQPGAWAGFARLHAAVRSCAL